MRTFIVSSISLSFMNVFQDPPHDVPLERAAEKGHTQTVEKLLEGKACVNHQNSVSITVQCTGEFGPFFRVCEKNYFKLSGENIFYVRSTSQTHI